MSYLLPYFVFVFYVICFISYDFIFVLITGTLWMFPLILQKGLHHPTTKETHSGPLHHSELPSSITPPISFQNY